MVKNMKKRFIFCGLVGWCLEIFWTGLKSLQRRQMKGMKVYVFQENNLIGAFTDYFANLEHSDLILPTRDLNDVLLEGIRIAEEMEKTAP